CSLSCTKVTATEHPRVGSSSSPTPRLFERTQRSQESKPNWRIRKKEGFSLLCFFRILSYNEDQLRHPASTSGFLNLPLVDNHHRTSWTTDCKPF
ncbi:hypothetical protein LEMLEM_LOCUS15257, partial [Lemmus lemmus]